MMLEPIEQWANDQWFDWFGDSPKGLTASLLAGGPAHRDRFAVFLAARGDRSPKVFIKVGRGDLERGRIEHEALAVKSLTDAEVPASRLPRVLGVFRSPDGIAAAYGVMKGRRLLVPQLLARRTIMGSRSMRDFWRQTGEIGLALAAAAGDGTDGDERLLGERVSRFATQFDAAGPDRAALEAFRLAVERERIRWQKSWQHGDVAVGNVLVDRKVVRLLDWEAASNDYEPWFDLATGPIAAVVLAHRQTGVGVSEACERVLAPDWWTGREMRSSLDALWSFSIPPGWAITLAAMHMALRRAEESRSMHSEYVEFARLSASQSSVGRLVASMGSIR